jgi:Zn-dependent protease with chaperone function
VIPILWVVALGFAAVMEAIIALHCLLRHPRSRALAGAALFAAPWQVLATLFGGPLLAALHTPSSFDPLGDGVDLFLQELALTFGLALLSFVLAGAAVLRALLAGPAASNPPKKTL